MSALPQELHSIRHDLHEPSRGPTPESTAAVLIPKALAEFGAEVALLIGIGDELEKRFTALARLDKQLRENGCTAPRPDLSAPLRAAWSQWKGEGFWERP
jgi:hypothetical protein